MSAGKDAEPRPGVLRLVDEARDAGLKVAVCSAATKSSVIHVVKSLFGEARYEVSCCLPKPGCCFAECGDAILFPIFDANLLAIYFVSMTSCMALPRD